MANITRRIIILLIALNMSLCLIVQAGSIHRPNSYDEQVSAILALNGLLNNADENSNHNEKPAINYNPSMLSLFDDDNGLRRSVNYLKDTKRSKLNLHTNLNLPRYLRTVD
ncbi:unnamed protein product [Rotaria magnacalcarata]|uniref:Uncharacterized protein n=1 Tax=Rotaria magnacalcarata TaxID=392030 RepID=A0A820SUY6_9BILA|nr:unnamed protein product [Rotaria magnacalcarata]